MTSAAAADVAAVALAVVAQGAQHGQGHPAEWSVHLLERQQEERVRARVLAEHGRAELSRR